MTDALDELRGPPRVSVVTPFYNTAEYLDECIQSVLEQTHANFEYVLIDNHSTDGSSEIARYYASIDQRIRLTSPPKFLSQVDNYNFAMAQIEQRSDYCKMVQADDWIYPECLERMVAIAQEHPTVGLISSYRLAGTRVDSDGLGPSDSILRGRIVGRSHLLGEYFLFGTQTTVMYRADAVRARRPFFSQSVLQFDTDVAYCLLADHDFAFVHQVLSFSREDGESTAARRAGLNARDLDFLVAVDRHAHEFLDPDEVGALRRRAERKYYQAYVSSWVRCMLRGEASSMADHNREGLRSVGRRLSHRGLAGGAVRSLLRVLACPARLIGSG